MSKQPIRTSVRTACVHRWCIAGWTYLYPDFDFPGHSKIEWRGKGPPADPIDEEDTFEVVR